MLTFDLGQRVADIATLLEEVPKLLGETGTLVTGLEQAEGKPLEPSEQRLENSVNDAEAAATALVGSLLNLRQLALNTKADQPTKKIKMKVEAEAALAAVLDDIPDPWED